MVVWFFLLQLIPNTMFVFKKKKSKNYETVWFFEVLILFLCYFPICVFSRQIFLYWLNSNCWKLSFHSKIKIAFVWLVHDNRFSLLFYISPYLIGYYIVQMNDIGMFIYILCIYNRDLYSCHSHSLKQSYSI